ncbi:hypothetical protein JCM33374_g4088 [Metschnikowia sp. JCM 33374]|nr:hypothetical protein JCM33374_g4088 [Metschnikowia sp. JCM 33374]
MGCHDSHHELTLRVSQELVEPPQNHRTTEPQNHRTTEPQNQNHRTTEPQNHRTTEPQNHRTTEPQNQIEVSKIPSMSPNKPSSIQYYPKRKSATFKNTQKNNPVQSKPKNVINR